MRASIIFSAGLAATAALTLTGCSGILGSDDDGDRLTIDSALGMDFGEEQDWAEQERRREELVAECMIAEGWEYIPVEYPDFDTDVEYTEDDEIERIEREGMGIAYYYLYPNGNPDDDYVDPWEDWVDPNQEYIESLSQAESEAYWESLYGSDEENAALQTVEIDPETGEEYYSQYRSGGCQGEAEEEIYSDGGLGFDEDYWMVMEEFYMELEERVQADGRIQELQAEWTSCMADQGFDYEDQDQYWMEVYEDFQQRADDIVGDDFYSDPLEGWSQAEIDAFFESATQEEIDALFSVDYDLDSNQRAALEDLLAEEVEVALAEYECSSGMWEQMEDIYADIEEQYVRDHEDELAAAAAQLAGDE